MVVVELFTSQGCSSCPPADKLLHRLAKKDNVLALALHVDYWDYLGWVDAFAKPEHTKRQKAYARVAKARMIYTPQMVVGGVDHVVGTRPMEVSDAILAHSELPEVVAVSLAREGGVLRLSGERLAGDLGKLAVQIVRYRPDQTVKIKRGENAGSTLTYANIVTELRVVAAWTEDTELDLEVPISGEDQAAVIIQKDGYREIVAAAKLP